MNKTCGFLAAYVSLDPSAHSFKLAALRVDPDGEINGFPTNHALTST